MNYFHPAYEKMSKTAGDPYYSCVQRPITGSGIQTHMNGPDF